jgi:hypothetical protein
MRDIIDKKKTVPSHLKLLEITTHNMKKKC